MEPPPFQEAARCDVCKCSFNTFRRRHHCRCCGRTLCYEHSSDQMALPQFGIHSPVRVCADCFNQSSQSVKDGPLPSSDVAHLAKDVSQLDIGEATDSKLLTTTENQPVVGISNCKCGMPLCICEAPTPSIEAIPEQKRAASTSSHLNTKPKKSVVTKSRDSSSNNQPSSFFNSSQVYMNIDSKSQIEYEANGEGLREAIKNGDVDAVKKLLIGGVDANYRDKQGLSLLHLAAVFNQTDIVFALIERGARLDYQNPQGETPLDCAPATLQYKIRERMKLEESGR